MSLSFTVIGQPAPQGSKKAYVRGGRAVVVEQLNDRIKSWREDVRASALDAIRDQAWEQATGPVELVVTFAFNRPRSHYRTGKHADQLRPDAPIMHAQTPDLDKIVRSTCDALVSAGVMRDDKQIARCVAAKVWQEAASCAALTVTPYEP